MNTPTVAMVVVRPAPLPVCLADVEVPSGWSCHVDQMAEGIFNALILGPFPERGLEIHLWPSLSAVFETCATYFGNRGLRHTWSALRASIEAEIRQ